MGFISLLLVYYLLSFIPAELLQKISVVKPSRWADKSCRYHNHHQGPLGASRGPILLSPSHQVGIYIFILKLTYFNVNFYMWIIKVFYMQSFTVITF